MLTVQIGTPQLGIGPQSVCGITTTRAECSMILNGILRSTESSRHFNESRYEALRTIAQLRRLATEVDHEELNGVNDTAKNLLT